MTRTSLAIAYDDGTLNVLMTDNMDQARRDLEMYGLEDGASIVCVRVEIVETVVAAAGHIDQAQREAVQ